MPIEQIVLDDFTGGYIEREASTDFAENQWAALRGFVLEDETRLRSQWAVQKVGTQYGFKAVAEFGSRLYAIDATGDIWYATTPAAVSDNATTRAVTWTNLANGLSGTSPENRRPLCPIQFETPDQEGFVTALLFNTAFTDKSNPTKPIAVYRHPVTNAVTYKQWEDTHPGGDEVAGFKDNVMPNAQYGVMWEDYLVLGNVFWFQDDSQPLSTTNVARNRNGLWISQPGNVDQFDPLSMVFVGTSDDVIIDLVVIDAGLLVLTRYGVYLLRGTPSDFKIESLRGRARCEVGAPWSDTGTAAWVTDTGEIWHTNGEDVRRLDTYLGLGIDITARKLIGALGPWLIVYREPEWLAMRYMEDANEGAWTSLIAPVPMTLDIPRSTETQLYYLDETGAPWRFARAADAERGKVDAANTLLALATRTIERGGGHAKTLWHRVGMRATGSGTVKDVKLRPGPALDASQPILTRPLNHVPNDRYDTMTPAHGASVEASVEVTFEGDVEVEQLSLWAHAGRGER